MSEPLRVKSVPRALQIRRELIHNPFIEDIPDLKVLFHNFRQWTKFVVTNMTWLWS